MKAEIILPKALEVKKALEAGLVDINALKQLIHLIENSHNPEEYTGEQIVYLNHSKLLEERIQKRKKRK